MASTASTSSEVRGKSWAAITARQKTVTTGRLVQRTDYHDVALRRGTVPEGGARNREASKSWQNMRRAHAQVYRYVIGNSDVSGQDYFWTCTFSRDVRDYGEAVAAWERFRRSLVAAFPDVRYCVVPERHKSGRWHFHAVLFGLPTVSYMRKRIGELEPGNTWRSWRRWFMVTWSRANYHSGGLGDGDRAEIQPVRKPSALGRYVAKYMVKELEDSGIPACRRAYFVGGKGLVKPQFDVRRDSIDLFGRLVKADLSPDIEKPDFGISRNVRYAGRVTWTSKICKPSRKF